MVVKYGRKLIPLCDPLCARTQVRERGTRAQLARSTTPPSYWEWPARRSSFNVRGPTASRAGPLSGAKVSSGAREEERRVDAGTNEELSIDGLAVGKLNPRFKVDPRNGSLLIMNAQPKQDEGRYECSLVEATGEANQPRTIKNEQLELELLVAPRLAPFEFAADAQVGMKVVLTCAALQGQQPISFVWLKDGRPIANEPSQTARSLGQLHQQQLAARLGETAPDGRRALAETDQSEAGAKLMELAPLWDQSVRVRQADDYSILSIERLELAHSGKYTCSAENEAARVSHSAQLSINGKSILVPESI